MPGWKQIIKRKFLQLLVQIHKIDLEKGKVKKWKTMITKQK
jgi:hypothetical protein